MIGSEALVPFRVAHHEHSDQDNDDEPRDRRALGTCDGSIEVGEQGLHAAAYLRSAGLTQ